MIIRADEMFEAASLTATSIEKAPYTSDAPHSAFNLRFGMSPYQWYAANPERGARFASAMAGWGESMSPFRLPTYALLWPFC